jgi:PAS domain S-box-containing protein
MFYQHQQATSAQVSITLRKYETFLNSQERSFREQGIQDILEISGQLEENVRENSSQNLKNIVRRYNLEKLSIINENGNVINSSSADYIGRNLFVSSITLENSLRNVFSRSIVFSLPVALDEANGQICQKFYYSPSGCNFFIEASYNIKKYLESNRLYRFHIIRLKKVFEIVFLSSFLTELELAGITSDKVWSLLTDGREIHLQPEIIQELLKDGKVTIDRGNDRMVYQIISSKNNEKSIFGNIPVIMILKYDISMFKTHTSHLIIFLVCVIIAVMIAAFVVFSIYFDRIYISRMLNINSCLQEITRGHYDVKVKVVGSDEVSVIGANINRMTEQIRKRENDLRESETRFRSIFENTPLGIVVLDLNRQIKYYNQALVNILGYSKDELKGCDCLSIIAPESRNQALESLLRLSKGVMDFYKNDRKLIRKDRSVILADIIVASIKDKDDQPANIIIMVNDITEKTVIEQQLIQAQKLEAVGKLASGVAHDFNNLLQVILGYGKIMTKHLTAAQEGKEAWDHIAEAGKRARNLVKQLLAFGRPASSANFTNIAPDKFLRSFSQMISKMLSDKINVEFVASSDLPEIKGDLTQLEQVMLNLCVNARDAMPDGGTITLSTEHIEADAFFTAQTPGAIPGDYVKFCVTDTGEGMDTEVKAHIFEPFYSTKEFGKGSGIGLASVHTIVKGHKGFIIVDSEPGGGSCFNIFIPVAGKDEAGKSKDEINDQLPHNLNGSGEMLLLCEDEEQVRNLGEIILNDAGYQILCAEDGDKAIELFNKFGSRLSLIILDMIMPGKSGREVFKYIREQDPDIPILFTTGYSKEMLNGEFGDNVIQKPYHEEQLLRKIKKMIGSREK